MYGPQRLVREGVLPPAVLFDQPGFLLPCHGIPVPDQAYLCLYAAHLARRPDGKWLVLTDRTQGPSGTGYTLENRIAVSRTLRNDFETLHIERLAPFFITLRDRLVSLALGGAKIHALYCFRRGLVARHLSKTVTWHGIWDTRWWKVAI